MMVIHFMSTFDQRRQEVWEALHVQILYTPPRFHRDGDLRHDLHPVYQAGLSSLHRKMKATWQGSLGRAHWWWWRCDFNSHKSYLFTSLPNESIQCRCEVKPICRINPPRSATELGRVLMPWLSFQTSHPQVAHRSNKSIWLVSLVVSMRYYYTDLKGNCNYERWEVS